MKNFLKEFQAFISKGNVMDLAVAVIIGAAFSAIVNSLVKDVVNPILGFVAGKPDFTNLFLVLRMPRTTRALRPMKRSPRPVQRFWATARFSQPSCSFCSLRL